jgi:release factor glutamine methyltransferase
MNIGEWLERATRALRDRSTSARLDAQVLLMHQTGLTRVDLITRCHEKLAPAQLAALDVSLARRLTGEPVAYITGEREFWSLPFTVTPATLIPRPETELLVERALARIPLDQPSTLADLGAGTGAIATAIASERPAAHIVAIDVSTDALAVARANIVRHQLKNVELREGSWCAPLVERVDVIVSNPPYICSGDPHLRGEPRFEPRLALVGGADGLDAIRAIAAQARDCLSRGGWLLLEHGFDQHDAVHAILSGCGYRRIAHYQDFAGHLRVTEGCWPGAPNGA